MAGAMTWDSLGVASPPSLPSLPAGADQYFNDGNSTVQGTRVDDYWLNKVGGELEAMITSGGVIAAPALNMGVYNQLLAVITAMVKPVFTRFIVPGSFTFTAPPGKYGGIVRMWGAGGNGGAGGTGAGGGGGGGEYVEFELDMTPGQTFSVYVSPGGSGNVTALGGKGAQSGANGNTGSSGSYIVGGIGGTSAYVGNESRTPGQAGDQGGPYAGGGYSSGAGGGSFGSHGSRSGIYNAIGNGATGAGFGAGGGGGILGGTGGTGNPGAVIIVC